MPPSEYSPSPEVHGRPCLSALAPLVRGMQPDPLLACELASIGASEEDIAALFCLTPTELNQRYGQELKYGAAQGREQALRKLHSLAMTGDNISLLTFVIKSRCGWRDTGTPQALLNIVRHISMFIPEGEKPLDHAPL